MSNKYLYIIIEITSYVLKDIITISLYDIVVPHVVSFILKKYQTILKCVRYKN